jgi:hypothetical protein
MIGIKEMYSSKVGLVQVTAVNSMMVPIMKIAILSKIALSASNRPRKIGSNHHQGTAAVVTEIISEATAGRVTRSQPIPPRTTMMGGISTMNGKGEDPTLALSPRLDQCTQASRTTKITTGNGRTKTSVMTIAKECIVMKEAQTIIMKVATITTLTDESIMANHLTSVSGNETNALGCIRIAQLKRSRIERIITSFGQKKPLNDKILNLGQR